MSPGFHHRFGAPGESSAGIMRRLGRESRIHFTREQFARQLSYSPHDHIVNRRCEPQADNQYRLRRILIAKTHWRQATMVVEILVQRDLNARRPTRSNGHPGCHRGSIAPVFPLNYRSPDDCIVSS